MSNVSSSLSRRHCAAFVRANGHNPETKRKRRHHRKTTTRERYDGRKDTGKEEEETGVMRNDDDDEFRTRRGGFRALKRVLVGVVAARCIVSGSQSSRAPEKKPEEKRK